MALRGAIVPCAFLTPSVCPLCLGVSSACALHCHWQKSFQFHNCCFCLGNTFVLALCLCAQLLVSPTCRNMLPRHAKHCQFCHNISNLATLSVRVAASCVSPLVSQPTHDCHEPSSDGTFFHQVHLHWNTWAPTGAWWNKEKTAVQWKSTANCGWWGVWHDKMQDTQMQLQKGHCL